MPVHEDKPGPAADSETPAGMNVCASANISFTRMDAAHWTRTSLMLVNAAVETIASDGSSGTPQADRAHPD